MKSYPYVGKFQQSINLFYAPNKFKLLESGNGLSRHEMNYTNITHEYLSNTWGVVESKEHAEFIIELAEGCGINIYGDINDPYFYISGFSLGFCDSPELASDLNEKQITIPLPPKAEANEAGHNLVFAAPECKEWPCVGDEVQPIDDKYNYGTCEVVKVKTNDSGVKMALVYSLKNSHPFWSPVSELQKPKTPEEALRDEVSAYLCDKYKFIFKAEAMEILESLLTKYNITPKEV